MARVRPQSSRRGKLADATVLSRNLLDDPRYQALNLPTRNALLVMAIKHADADGCFYRKQAEIAAESGCARGTLNKGLGEAEKVGLIIQEHYARPKRRGQGASNYRFDPALLGTQGVTQGYTRGVSEDDSSHGVVEGDTPDGVIEEDTRTNDVLNEKNLNVVDDALVAVFLKPITGSDALPPLTGAQRTRLNAGITSNPDAVKVCVQRVVKGNYKRPIGGLMRLLEQCELDGWRTPPGDVVLLPQSSAARLAARARRLEALEQRAREWLGGEGRLFAVEDQLVVLTDNYELSEDTGRNLIAEAEAVRNAA